MKARLSTLYKRLRFDFLDDLKHSRSLSSTLVRYYGVKSDANLTPRLLTTISKLASAFYCFGSSSPFSSRPQWSCLHCYNPTLCCICVGGVRLGRKKSGRKNSYPLPHFCGIIGKLDTALNLVGRHPTSGGTIHGVFGSRGTIVRLVTAPKTF